ncbi:hypothetical protein Tco_0879726, partial [Tanacetum coccineum]
MSSSPHSTIVPSDSDIEDAFSSTNILNYFPASPGNIFPNPFKKISSPKDIETSVESPISISPSSSVGSSSPVSKPSPRENPMKSDVVKLFISGNDHENIQVLPRKTGVTFAMVTLTDDALSGGNAFRPNFGIGTSHTGSPGT